MKLQKGKKIIKNLPEISKEEARYYVDKKSTYIYMKCGHCSECIHERINAYAQRILMESIDNHLFLITLTYKNSMLPAITCDNGKTIHFADSTDVRNMFDRLDKWRDRCDHTKQYIKWPYKYLAVSELGGRKARPHFHILLLIPKRFAKDEVEIRQMETNLYWTIRNNWTRNEGSKRNPIYTPLFKYAEHYERDGTITKNYDLHYVRPETTKNGVSDAAFYVLKYLIKQQNNYENKNTEKEQTAVENEMVNKGWEYRKMCYLKKTLPTEEFNKIWPMIKSKCFYSKHFGLGVWKHENGNLIINHNIEYYIKDCIKWSKGKYDYPVFINPINKRTSPLCEYYRKKFMTLQDIKDFWKDENEGLSKYGENPRYDTQLSVKLDKAKAVERKLKQLNKSDYYDD